MHKILVATGTSANKLKFTIEFIENYLQEKAIPVEIRGMSIYDVNETDLDMSVIVAIGPHSFTGEIPVINGTAFITKMGMEDCCEEIISLL
ncbi:PTS sugar transporter subunit IIB [Enterococcus rivorum]|uniref:Uncharacterized protein n=1 Tax=Enterococcus rivorum TaxID=762845 RepID=A0A1E5KUV5_9ENTE|nr:hypothetical protein [Enterococcus rivorum]MBP2100505.1 PTS system galactitol-specific IIB component [Enterococcus rivorum]OEH81630.1 hypothetical protein BCR26_16040 [Enterococcus rivorum]